MRTCGWWRWSPLVGLLLVLACGDSARPAVPPLPATLESFDARVGELLRETHAALEEQPADPRRWVEVGKAFEAHGVADVAARYYEQALGLRPAEARWWYRLSMAREAADDLVGARAAMREALARDDSYAPAHWRTGYWQLDEGEADAARASFERALELDPASEPARLGLVQLDLRGGSPERALAALQGSPILDGPNGPFALKQLGTALQRVGQEQEAEPLLATYRQAKPAFRDPWNEELASYERGMATINRRARAMIAGGRPVEALRLLEQARAQEPEHVPILRTLGAAYSAAGRTRDAQAVLREAARLEPQNIELRVDAAWATAMYGDLDEALEEVASILADDPACHKAHSLRARVLLDLGQPAQAVAACQVALEHGAREPRLLVDVGKTQIELGQLEGAAASFELATAQDPGLLPAWVGRALVALELGRLDQARAALERAGAIHRGQPVAGDEAILGVLSERLDELQSAAERSR